jgi:inorganic pyrophosphatase
MKLGKHWVEHIARSPEPDAWIPVVNEIPAGSCCKYRLDKVTDVSDQLRFHPAHALFRR